MNSKLKELLQVELTITDIKYINECKNNINSKLRVYNIIEELYILVKKHNLTTKEIAEIYNVGVRNVQKWLKELGLNRSIKKAIKLTIKKNKQSIKKNKEVVKPIKKEVRNFSQPMNNYIDKDINKSDKWIYMFMHEDIVLYVGKCERSESTSTRKNGYIETRDYTLKNRIQAHFSNNNKHLPEYFYDLVDRIVYYNVPNDEDIEQLESALICKYRLNNQCLFNKKSAFIFDYDLSKVKFSIYNERKIDINKVDIPHRKKQYI